MAKKRGLEPSHDDHINVTPLIDIVMCLIIFFMICGKMVQGDIAEISIPKAKKAQELEDQRNRLIINIVPTIKDGLDAKNVLDRQSLEPTLKVHGNDVPFDKLTEVLRAEKQANPELRLLIRADRDVIYRHMSRVIVSVAQADIKSLHFATEQEY